MSLLESLMVALKGGWPKWPCAACGAEVDGDDCGAVDVDSGAVWCHPCAEELS